MSLMKKSKLNQKNDCKTQKINNSDKIVQKKNKKDKISKNKIKMEDKESKQNKHLKLKVDGKKKKKIKAIEEKSVVISNGKKTKIKSSDERVDDDQFSEKGFDKKLKRKFKKIHADNLPSVKRAKTVDQNIDIEDAEKDDGNSKNSQSIENSLKLKNIPSIGFSWNVSLDDLNSLRTAQEGDSENEEKVETNKVKPRLSKAEKLAAAKELEAKIRQAEEELLQDGDPVSSAQFDRLLLAQPNNSELWVKYMAYHLQATEIDKGRAVARRALTVINIRNEEDRLNVWTALLNLEHLYGTEDSLQECLSEAVRCNDDVKVYSKMADIYAESGQIRELGQTIKSLIKKAGQNHSVDVWLKCANLLLKIGQKQDARHLLQRGLNTLPATLHLQLISRFALLENTHGDSDRAQALFEHTLTTYPGRVDVWSVYVDMLVKSKRVDLAKQVLERAVSQKLAPKKLKPLYTKWLKIEELYGDKESVENVKREIQRYVHNTKMTLST